MRFQNDCTILIRGFLFSRFLNNKDGAPPAAPRPAAPGLARVFGLARHPLAAVHGPYLEHVRPEGRGAKQGGAFRWLRAIQNEVQRCNLPKSTHGR